MTSPELQKICQEKADELLEKYFPDFIYDAAQNRPEELSVEYNEELPYKVEKEFLEYLAGLWEDYSSQSDKSFDEIMNRHLNLLMVDAEYVPELKAAREKAEQISLWEKITQSNHEDVTYYKGLLRQYTRELLKVTVKDFVEDLPLS